MSHKRTLVLMRSYQKLDIDARIIFSRKTGSEVSLRLQPNGYRHFSSIGVSPTGVSLDDWFRHRGCRAVRSVAPKFATMVHMEAQTRELAVRIALLVWLKRFMIRVKSSRFREMAAPRTAHHRHRLIESTTMKNRKTVYVEATVISYLTARPSRDLRVAARRLATTEWWDIQRPYFELFTSIPAMDAAQRDHQWVDARHLDVLDSITKLPIADEAKTLADALMHRRELPRISRNDAVQVAVSAVNGIDYLMTWNFETLANTVTMPVIRETCEKEGLRSPVICSPNELWVIPPDH